MFIGMKPTTTIEPGSDVRQTCCRCLHTVGTLPSGSHRAYRTEVKHWPDGVTRRFHSCLDNEGCAERATEVH